MIRRGEARRALVWEKSDRPGMGVAAQLRRLAQASPLELEIVVTTSHEEALRRLQAQSFAVAIIDVGRESGEALALLRAFGRGFPFLPLFVFNGFMIPGIAEKAREYAQARTCEDPRELDRFIQLVMGELAGKKKGMIEGVQLVNVLDWLQREKLSGQVVVSGAGRKGVLDFREGWLVSARSGTDPDGGTALAEMSTWERVSVEFQEGEAPEVAAASSRIPPSAFLPVRRGVKGNGGQESLIETLSLPRGKGRLTVRIGELWRIGGSVREAVGDSLLHMDIFLTADGRSLVGWNSQPLACSAFAVVTRSIIHALETSGFPALGDYYLIDLAGGQLAAVLVCSELQIGLLLKRERLQMGLLTRIVLPEAAKAIGRSYALEPPA